MQFSGFAAFLLTLLAGQALASPARGATANAGKEGKACTGSVNNLQMKGTCTANGKCGINIPPNEFAPVPSADCE